MNERNLIFGIIALITIFVLVSAWHINNQIEEAGGIDFLIKRDAEKFQGTKQ